MKTKLCVLLCCISIKYSYSQTDSLGFTFLPQQYQRQLSINPDFSCVKLTRTGYRWDNSVGATIPLVGYSTPKKYLSVSMAGFINLHDISDNQLMSWQMWRGNLGFDIQFFPFKNNTQHSFSLTALLHHESQHVTDLYTFSDEFLKPSFFPFDNASARSFEFVGLEVKDVYNIPETRLNLYGAVTARYFSKPVLPNAVRQQISAYSTEIGVQYKVSKKHNHLLYLHYFYEQVLNDFVSVSSPYRTFWNKQPFAYKRYELGLFLTNAKNKNNFSVFAGHNNSNGRGLDFLRQYQEWYYGIRFNL